MQGAKNGSAFTRLFKKSFFATCRNICKVADAEKKYFAPRETSRFGQWRWIYFCSTKWIRALLSTPAIFKFCFLLYLHRVWEDTCFDPTRDENLCTVSTLRQFPKYEDRRGGRKRKLWIPASHCFLPPTEELRERKEIGRKASSPFHSRMRIQVWHPFRSSVESRGGGDYLPFSGISAPALYDTQDSLKKTRQRNPPPPPSSPVYSKPNHIIWGFKMVSKGSKW